MKIMHIKTTDDREYTYTVQNKLDAKDVLLTLQRLGILCKWWKYEEVPECSHNG